MLKYCIPPHAHPSRLVTLRVAHAHSYGFEMRLTICRTITYESFNAVNASTTTKYSIFKDCQPVKTPFFRGSCRMGVFTVVCRGEIQLLCFSKQSAYESRDLPVSRLHFISFQPSSARSNSYWSIKQFPKDCKPQTCPIRNRGRRQSKNDVTR